MDVEIREAEAKHSKSISASIIMGLNDQVDDEWAPTSSNMRTVFLLTASVLTVAGVLIPAHADTLETGVPSQGVYWGLSKDSLGRVYYECFDEKTNETVNEQKCSDAMAKKPARVYRRVDLW
jgi:hypothetical protein